MLKLYNIKNTSSGILIELPHERRMTMKSVEITLNSIDKVKSFVNIISKYDTDFDLVSGRYVIDAKSIMGIFSLDLSKPIRLDIHDNEEADAVIRDINAYVVD